MTVNAGPLRGDPSVTDLVTRARKGERRAWDALVERYSPLVWSICRRHQLDGADANDVGRKVWLHLAAELDKIRDPAALPGWLAMTATRECWRALREARPQAAGHVLDLENIPGQQNAIADDELVVAERHASLREAFAGLPVGDQQLIALLIAEPPVSYAEISAKLGIPGDSIGPTRGRCLDRLRSHPAIAALSNAGARSAAGGTHKPC